MNTTILGNAEADEAFIKRAFFYVTAGNSTGSHLARRGYTPDGKAPGHFWKDWPNEIGCRIPCYWEQFHTGTDINGANDLNFKTFYIREILKDPAGYTDQFNKKFLLEIGKSCGFDKITMAEFRRAADLNDWMIKLQ